MRTHVAETSIEAFHAHVVTGKASAQQARILSFIAARGGDWIKMRSALLTALIREAAIRFAMALHIAAYQVQRWAGDHHQRLIFGRSAAQIARMEHRKGLR